MVFHSIFQRNVLCQYPPPWFVQLGWPCMTCLMASLSYTRLWPVRSFWLAFCDCDFHSWGCRIAVLACTVCPLIRDLCKIPEGKDWLWEKLSLALDAQQATQDWKSLLFITISKKDNARECSNCHTIALISHTNKITFKILQARLQKYLNQELLDVQTGLEKAEEPEI